MVPVLLKLSNFTSYGENIPELNFAKFHLAVISGSNGVGKSSLLDAITWCLWGWSRAGDNSDQLVRLGAQEMYVEFSFDLDDNTYTVKRKRSLKSGGSTALELWSNSHNLTEGTIKATQQKIINLLHLTIETFTNSSFLRQGHADEFTTKGPTDRKRVLADILGLDHYDILEEKAKEKIKQIQNNLTLLEYQLLELEAELSQKNDSEEKKVKAEKKISELENKIIFLEKDLKKFQEEKAALKATNDQQQKLKQTLSALQEELSHILAQGKNRAEKINQLEVELVELPTFEEKLKELKDLEKEKEEYSKNLQKKLELEKQLTSFKSELALKNQQKQILEQKIEEIKSHIESLDKDSSKCPTCGQIINTDQKKKVKTDYIEQGKKLKLEISEIKTVEEESKIQKLDLNIKSINLDDHKYRQTLQKLNELSIIQDKRELLIAAQATLESEKKVVQELRGLFGNKKIQIEKLEEEVKKLPDLQNNLTILENQVNQKEIELNTLRLEEKEARNLLGQATELISRVQQTEKVQKEKSAEKEKLNKEKDIYMELGLAFGKKGIQAMIIETAIPEIETEANNLLQELTNGRMQVRFETQKETKTKGADGEKGLVETLDIIISDEMGERPYEMYSGGEAFRVNLSIRLALSKLLTRRAGAKLQFLVIDEGFGTQDADGISKIVDVLDTIKNDFEKIVVITHLDELKEEFPIRIEVSKTAVGSTFQIIGT